MSSTVSPSEPAPAPRPPDSGWDDRLFVFGDDPPRESRAGRRWAGGAPYALVAAVALLAPFAVAIVVSLARPWWPWGDQALIELRTHDVGGAFNPLVGSYSRFGWYHPGPMAFWVLAVPYRLLGARPAGMLVGTVLVHAVSVAGCLMLARRQGGASLTLLTALVLAALLRGFGLSNAIDVWNPYLPLFATAFLVLAVWSVLEGDLWLLPVVVAVSCFAWQAHLGYAPVAGVLAAVALAGGGWRLAAAMTRSDRSTVNGDRNDASAPWRSPVLVAAVTIAAGVGCVAPIVVEQVTSEPGNLDLIVTSMTGGHGPAIGRQAATKIAASVLAPGGTWATGGDPTRPLPLRTALLWLALTASMLAAAVVLAWRAGARSAARLGMVAGATTAVAVLAVSRTVGSPVLPYLFAWVLPIAAVLWLAVAWCLWSVLRRHRQVVAVLRSRSGSWEVPAMGVLAVVGVATLSIATVVGEPARLPGESVSATVGALAPAVERASSGIERVRLRSSGGACTAEIPPGLAALLVESGKDVAVDPEVPAKYGRDRERDAGERLPMLEVYCGVDTGERVHREPDAPIAVVNVLSTEELSELRSLQERFRDELRRAGRLDLLPVVNNDSAGGVLDLASAGHTFAAADTERYASLMAKGRFSAALFWRP